MGLAYIIYNRLLLGLCLVQQLQLCVWALSHNIHFFKVDFFWAVTLFAGSTGQDIFQGRFFWVWGWEVGFTCMAVSFGGVEGAGK